MIDSTLFANQNKSAGSFHDKYKSFEYYSVQRIRKRNRRNKSQKRVNGGHMRKAI